MWLAPQLSSAQLPAAGGVLWRQHEGGSAGWQPPIAAGAAKMLAVGSLAVGSWQDDDI